MKTVRNKRFVFIPPRPKKDVLIVPSLVPHATYKWIIAPPISNLQYSDEFRHVFLHVHMYKCKHTYTFQGQILSCLNAKKLCDLYSIYFSNAAHNLSRHMLYMWDKLNKRLAQTMLYKWNKTISWNTEIVCRPISTRASCAPFLSQGRGWGCLLSFLF